MIKKIIECVPNFSEGRDSKKIGQIAAEIKKIKGVKLLDVESDKSHNRTVVTFVGEPQAVKRAAFSAIAKAAEIIDMVLHKGEHPRTGATDVCPFVPVKGATIKDCVKLARELGNDVGKKLGIPVYLYEEASQNPARKKLEDIRRGEYEGLAERLKLKEWKPDYGPAKFNSRSGATIIGAREFLIAFNVNLKSRNIDLAKKIAGIIRESGVVRKMRGQKIRMPGVFRFVKALGVDLRDQKLVQVSMNLTNYKITPMHLVFEIIKRIAGLTGAEIRSSEIVGIVPEEALLMAGKFYSPGTQSKKELIKIAIDEMLLGEFKRFIPEKKIIERMV